MDPLKLQAEVLGSALSLDLIDAADVVLWADSIVAVADKPDPSVLAISVDALGARFDSLDAIHALSRVSGRADGREVAGALLGVLGQWLDRDSSSASAWKIANAVCAITFGAPEVTTPSGCVLEVDDDMRDKYDLVDRAISTLDIEEWRLVLANFLLHYRGCASRVWFPRQRAFVRHDASDF